MARILIVYHSQSGNTEAMAKAVAEGAASVGSIINLKKATEATRHDILAGDMLAFGSPVYFSYMAGALKDFFDRVYYAIQFYPHRKAYVAFGSAGGGGREALDAIEDVCASCRLMRVHEGVVAKGKPTAEILEQCRDLGKKLALQKQW